MRKKRPLLKMTAMIFVLVFGKFSFGFAEEPWWAMGYEVTGVTEETTYSYGTDGKVSETKTEKKPGSLTFKKSTAWKLSDFPESDQNIYNQITAIKKETPDISDEDLLHSLLGTFGRASADAVINMLGFYEYDTETGFYEYLQKKPDPKEVKIFDARFDLYASDHNTPPETFDELKRLEAETLALLSQKFKISEEEITDILYKLEKYQEKHGLAKDRKLSETL